MVDIIHRIGIKASPARVFEAVSSAAGIAGWWSKDTTKLGERVTVRFHDPQGDEIGMCELEIVELVPNQQVRWRIQGGPAEWIGTEVVFELAQAGDRTIVRFSHRHWREAIEFTAHCSMKWATFLLSLRDLVETGTGKPSPVDLKIDDWN